MFENYLKITFRNIRKQKIFTIINVFGLVIGLVTSVLIFLYVHDELTYDKFHKEAKNIYRVTETRFYTETPRNFATSYIPLSLLLENDFPEIKQVRLSKFEGVVGYGKKKTFNESRFFYSDSTIFTVFDFKLLFGKASEVLAEPFTIVITEKTAEKYFGKENPIGKILLIDNKLPFRITGIVANPPQNSHIKFDFLASFETIGRILGHASTSQEAWWAPQIYHYLLLPKELQTNSFIKKFPDYVNEHIKQWMGEKREFKLQTLLDIHLRSDLENELEPNNTILQIFVLSAVAIFILIIACLNYMNLATAKSLNRARETALRKVSGASRKQLIWQFLSESMLWSFVSLIIAIGLIEILLPYFNELSGKSLSIGNFGGGKILLALIALTIVVGFVSGSYPAFYLSGVKPIDAIKGTPVKGKGNPAVRKLLVIIQFSISSLLICFSLLVGRQLDYIQNRNLGFASDYLLVVPLPDKEAKEKVDILKERLMNNEIIKSCSASGGVPGKSSNSEFPYKIESTPETGSYPNILTFAVDYSFFETYQLKLQEGRFFSHEYATDKHKSFVINEAARKTFGWKSAADKDFTLFQFNGKKMETKQGEIIGVVKNFHYRSLHYGVEPMVIQISPAKMFFSYLSIRLKAGYTKQSIKYIEENWNKLFPGKPFNFFFLDKTIENQYNAESRLNKIINYFTVLAILIASLGLFGLSAFSIEQRTKEIGVRKVLGAKTTEIVNLLMKEFAKWVLIANFFAMPFSLLFMNVWLERFVYHTSAGFFIFLLTILFSVVVALLTVTWQILKSSKTDPIVALRHE